MDSKTVLNSIHKLVKYLLIPVDTYEEADLVIQSFPVDNPKRWIIFSTHNTKDGRMFLSYYKQFYYALYVYNRENILKNFKKKKKKRDICINFFFNFKFQSNVIYC